MRILIAEDKPETIVGIEDFCQDNNIDYKEINDFNKVDDELQTNNYDLLILDLKKDPGEEYPGCDIFSRILKNKFLPVIIFSSYFQNMQIYDHKFITYFEKDKEEDVKKKILEYKELLPKINVVKSEINKLMIEGMRCLNAKDNDNTQLQRIIIYMKNYLDNMQTTGERLPADIQLVDLPKYNELITCDIIEKLQIAGKINDKEYYMILTPWCEISKQSKIECKKLVKKESIAECKQRKLDGGKNNGGAEEYILLPDNRFFKNYVVDCKLTEIIEKDKISLNQNETNLAQYEFKKIFSIASPFRERMINLCYDNRKRIGVPNLDVNSWCVNEEN